MTSQPFIVKYSPYSLNDFCCETTESPVNRSVYVLKTLIELNDMNVLLIGGANSGKTSMLQGLLREYYGLEKGVNPSDANVLSINNLKEQGIQFFRNEMKTFCQTHCTLEGRKKVIMIDDIDGINKQSQQVFRNYIDKYKAHVCVIASCTNSQKVVESLQSRLHIIQIQPPSMSQIRGLMEHIIREEAILVEDDCRDYLLSRSNGSVRNVITNLEKMAIYCDGAITKTVCEKLCSTISFNQFELYIAELKTGNLRGAIRVIYDIHDYGYSVIDILEYFFEFVKTTEMLDDSVRYAIAPYICDYISVFHNIHENGVELAFFTRNILRILHPAE